MYSVPYLRQLQCSATQRWLVPLTRHLLDELSEWSGGLVVISTESMSKELVPIWMLDQGNNYSPIDRWCFTVGTIATYHSPKPLNDPSLKGAQIVLTGN